MRQQHLGACWQSLLEGNPSNPKMPCRRRGERAAGAVAGAADGGRGPGPGTPQAAGAASETDTVDHVLRQSSLGLEQRGGGFECRTQGPLG